MKRRDAVDASSKGCLCPHGLLFNTDSVRCEDSEDKGEKGM